MTEKHEMPEVAKKGGFDHLFLDNQPAYDQLIGLICCVPDLWEEPDKKEPKENAAEHA